MPLFNPAIETMSREDLRALQLARLQDIVRFTFERVPFYRERMEAAGVSPEDIRSLDDVRRLPFMEKPDFRAQYPFGMLAVPRDEVVRIHASSGTTGKATVAAYTAGDLEMWAECAARALGCAGMTKADTVQIAYGYGLFTGGLGMHDGATRMGAAVVPASTGGTEKQIGLLVDFGVNGICCTPSYALQIAEVAEQMGVDLRKQPLRSAICGAEPWTEGMRANIESRLGVQAFDIYGLTEACGPGVGCSCEAHDGIHLCEDFFLVELIDPDTGEPVPDGERGELIVTALCKRGMPLVRYRTHDLTRVVPGPCSCGRTHKRIARFTGRTDDMLIIRGINVFPSQVEDVLVRIDGVLPQYLLVVERTGNLDTLEIKVEVEDRFFSDTVRALENLRSRVAHQIKSIVNVNAKITLVEPGSLARTLGKAKRVDDRRKLV
jgi:phenylacetate-CoA ligase